MATNDTRIRVTIEDQAGHELDITSGGAIPIELATADIEIGAVEIKNGSDDTRAEVTSGNAVSANIKQIAGATAVSGSGTATGALRVELPTNGTGVIATVGAVTAITNALPAGTNAIGKLAANSGVDIGDVDVASIAAGSNIIGHTRSLGGASATNLSSDTLVKSGAGNLVGIFVASSTSGTIKVWDNTSATGTVLVNTFSAGAATWYPLPFAFGTGLYVDIGGTIDLTVSYT